MNRILEWETQMDRTFNRRELLVGGASAGLSVAGIGKAAGTTGPTVLIRQDVKPVVISSSNGNQFKNGGTQTCVEKAFQLLTQGSDVLDALLAGVNIVELDPRDTSVGY